MDNIAKAKAAKAEGTDFVYDERDVILYSKLDLVPVAIFALISFRFGHWC